MLYSLKIQEAIQLSIRTHEIHQKQKRKGKDVPYIVHPLAVGLVLARAGASENLVIAGILHDTIEDSTKEEKVTRALIEEKFGSDVARLVNAVTEQDREASWEDRKADALAHISTMKEDEILLKSADVVANMSDLIADIEKDGVETLDRFNAPRERILEHYHKLAKTLLEAYPESPLADDLEFISTKLKAFSV